MQRYLVLMPNGVSLGVVGGLVVASVCVACRDRNTPLAPDTIPPVYTVQSPIDTVYDLDGDGFLDLSITWQDAGGAVNTSGVVVRSLEGVNGPAPGASNLLTAWRIETRNQQALVLHETIENLLHGGTNRLEVRIPDTAGNTLVDTIAFVLPHGKFLQTIVTGLTSPVSRGVGIVYCEDDGFVYMAAGRNIVVAHPESLRVNAIVQHPDASDDLRFPICVPGDPVLYVTDFVERFDRLSRSWLPRVAGSFASIAIGRSRTNDSLLYVGESLAGSIGIINRFQNARTGSYLPFDTTQSERVFSLAVLQNDEKLYATRYSQTGILVTNPQTGQVLKHLSVGGAGWPDSGRTDAIVLSHDDQVLYVAVLDGNPRGVLALSTGTDAIIGGRPLPDYVPQLLGLSPSGRRLFVTTQDRFPSFPSKNVLLDAPSLTVLQEFDRPRPQGAFRFDGGVAFRRDGKIAFVCHNMDIDVYLIRE